MVHLHCQKLTKRYGSQVIVDQLDWSIKSGQSWGVIGPSGAGKTTLLRILAGLEQCSSGEVAILEESQVRIRKPTIGMGFQHLGLWPHLTALQHILAVLKDSSRKKRLQTASEQLEEVCLPRACHDKRPGQLSGGEMQRLAIARALAVRPHLLLLDEPLAQVDTVLRSELIRLLREMIDKRNITSIYVTHSWSEASQIAEHIGVMLDGKFVQTGTTEDIYRAPVNPTVAKLTGPFVEIPRRAVDDGRICMSNLSSKSNMRSDLWIVRPQQLELIASSESNRWEVTQCNPSGFVWEVTFVSDKDRIQTAVCRKLRRGDIVGLNVSEVCM
jgi:putative spermidine/putrescine transport system ATP-binding protein